MRGRARASPIVVSIEPIERKWRVGPPTSGVAGSLYDFVRRYLVAHDGACSRDELLAASLAEPLMKERLSRSQGFTSLLHNMRHSGDVILEGDVVRPSLRTFQRLGLDQQRTHDRGTVQGNPVSSP